jgi:hypothetical protein
MSYPSLYIGNCGHAYNCLEIFEVFQASGGYGEGGYGEGGYGVGGAGDQAALACCPVCSAIQEIFDPYGNFSNYEITPIVVA